MLAKLLFKPLGAFFGVFVANKITVKAFDERWERRNGTEAPTAMTESATWPQVLTAAALKGAIAAVAAAGSARIAAKGFRHITGFWPGEEHPPPAKRFESKR